MVRSLLVQMAVVLLASGLWWQPAAAKGDGWRENTQYLPSYCAYRATPQGKANKAGKYPSLKPIWQHIHHYCSGAYAEFQARKTTNPQRRKQHLSLLISEMTYVGRHCDTRCILYPELHSRWGWALNEQGKVPEAIKHYKAAIKARPSYSKAYALLADLYVGINQRGEARKVLEEGLKRRPKSRALQRRLKKLG